MRNLYFCDTCIIDCVRPDRVLMISKQFFSGFYKMYIMRFGMTLSHWRVSFLIVASTIFFTHPEIARADFLGLLAGSTIDHAADRAEQLVARARDAALAIEAQTNEDISERLKQV